jgi:hypothetical protein
MTGEAKGYRVDVNMQSRRMRIVLCRDEEMKDVVAWLECTSSEGYDLAQHILKKFDIIEGLHDHG